ncbi:hypothetical protein BH11BAC7_BH11BAC7_21680 [soil metagenome]
MKKLFPFIAFLSILIFSGCDKVLIPQQPHSSVVQVNDTFRKIFIEDFTGHTCQNCPAAAHVLENLKNAYPGQVIGMSVHIDYFAIPCPPNPLPFGAQPGTFSEDFRSNETSDYQAIYDCANWPYPNGLINRSGISPVDHTTWASATASLLADSMTAYIKINPTYNATTRSLNITVTGEFLCDTTGTYNIALYLVESALTGSQVDGSTIDNNYVFNDVLRGCINTPGFISGEQITLPATIPGHTPINYTSPSFTVNANYNSANCKIIAILINNADRGVLQAAEVDVQ